MKKLLLLLLFLSPGLAFAAAPNFTYQQILTINHLKVAADQTDFPFLATTTDANLKVTGSGGHVTNSSGFDIIYSPYDCTSLNASSTPFYYYWENEQYISSTGLLASWIKIPSLSSTVDTTLYRCFGDSGITTQQGNPTLVWVGYTGVWHMSDNAANTTVVDSIASGHNGTFTTNTGNRTITGQIVNALDSHAAGDNTGMGNVLNTSWGTGVSFTFEIWFKANTFPAAKSGLITKTGNAVPGPLFTTRGANLYYEGYDGTRNPFGFNNTSLSTATWYSSAYVRDVGATTGRFYLNGATDGTITDNTTDMGSASDNLTVGNSTNNGGVFDGQLDEVRISNSVRSASWISTEYNNQLNVGTFVTQGAASALSVSVTHAIVKFLGGITRFMGGITKSY